MSLEIAAVQRALKQDGLDGWLLYDFHGSNPIAARVAGLASSNKMATRRRYYLIPASGEPRGLVHAIESHNLEGLPGEKRQYAGRELLANGLRDLMRGMKKVAMEYSPGNAIPYISRVDAGTVEAVRALGVDVVSSGDLVQRFEAVWNDAAIHRATNRNEIVLLDLWGKLPTPGAVFADITWVGYTGSTVPERYAKADRDQHVHRRAGGRGHRRAADRDRSAVLARRTSPSPVARDVEHIARRTVALSHVKGEL